MMIIPSTMKKTNRTNILLIERDDSLRESLAELLSLNGFWVIKARNTSSALQLAEQLHPNLVICARSFPDGDCSKILLALREKAFGKDIPVIFLSSKPAGCLHQMMLKQERVITLIKPFKTEELLAAIQQSFGLVPVYLIPKADGHRLAV